MLSFCPKNISQTHRFKMTFLFQFPFSIKKIEDISEHGTLETVNDLRYSYSYEAKCLLFMKYFVNKEMPLKNPSMLDLNYSFDDSPLNQLTQSYLDDLKQYERKLEVTGDIFAPLSMVSPSISF